MMDVVIDTNILVSALLTPGRVRKTFLHPRIRPHAPKRVIVEMLRHAGKISRHIGIDEEILKPLLEQTLPIWVNIHEEEVIPQSVKEEAKRLVAGVDPDDWPFVALAVFLGIPLWTGDKGLIRLGLETGEYIAVDTEGVELLLRGEPLDSVLERMRGKYLK